MTESEWLGCGKVEPMIRHLRKQRRHAPSDRKWRLFCCACARRIIARVAFDGDLQIVEAAERYADGLASLEELRTAGADGRRYGRSLAREDIGARAREFAAEMVFFARHLGGVGVYGDRSALQRASAEEEEKSQVALARCVFGNPFRDPPFRPEWRTADVVALAQGIYTERAFDRMPILADALQDAGCDDEELLSHCREKDALHARGCWAVDCALGKE